MPENRDDRNESEPLAEVAAHPVVADDTPPQCDLLPPITQKPRSHTPPPLGESA